MEKNHKCFISVSKDVDLLLIKGILLEYNIETIDIYDFSIGDSAQQILKRKIQQSDFALFVISNIESADIIYEVRVCEGIGRQCFIFSEKNCKIPTYLENQVVVKTEFGEKKLLRAYVEKILPSRCKRKNQVKQHPYLEHR